MSDTHAQRTGTAGTRTSQRQRAAEPRVQRTEPSVPRVVPGAAAQVTVPEQRNVSSDNGGVVAGMPSTATIIESTEGVAARTRSQVRKAAAMQQLQNEPIARQTRSRSTTETAFAAAFNVAAALGSSPPDNRQLAARRFPKATLDAALAVMCTDTGKMMKYRDLLTHPDPILRGEWCRSSANEFGRLFQGVGGRIAAPTNTCYFVHKHEVPPDRMKDVTYGKFECSK